jgi:hypothetical protein
MEAPLSQLPGSAVPTPEPIPFGRGWLQRNGFARKVLTKPVWWWERRRQHPIRERVWQLPPLATAPAAPTTVAILTATTHVADAAWAARSLLCGLRNPVRLVLLLDDREMSRIDRDAFLARTQPRVSASFPGAELIPATTLADTLAAEAPTVAAYGRAHPMGLKLAAVLALHRQGHLLYSDADVLAFSALAEIDAAIAAGGPPLHLQCVAATSSDPVVAARVRERGRTGCASMNAGFVFVPRGALALDEAEDLLRGLDFNALGWFAETTVFSALMHRAGAQPLPRARYVVSPRRQFYFEEDLDYATLTLRHFVTPVRPLMYARALPLLWKRWTAAAAGSQPGAR